MIDRSDFDPFEFYSEDDLGRGLFEDRPSRSTDPCSDPDSFTIHKFISISYQNKSLEIEKMDRSFGFFCFSYPDGFSAFKILISYDMNKDDKGAKKNHKEGALKRPQIKSHSVYPFQNDKK